MYLAPYSKHVNRMRAAQLAMHARGVNSCGHRLWNEDEDDICRKYYLNYKRLLTMLPGRTPAAIQSRCRDLGIQNKLKPWTADEHLRFRKAYRTLPTKDLASAFPGRTLRALHQRGVEYNLSRPKKPYAKTGNYLLDELRSECSRRNITMRDLDQFARSKNYFAQKLWSGKRGTVRYQVIVNAIQCLGGKLEITWEDCE